jgi:hypothetical protein
MTRKAKLMAGSIASSNCLRHQKAGRYCTL